MIHADAGLLPIALYAELMSFVYPHNVCLKVCAVFGPSSGANACGGGTQSACLDYFVSKV